MARPIRDLFIPSNQALTVYAGYPASMRIIASNTIVFADPATELMSETWLGRNKLPQTSHTIRAPEYLDAAERMSDAHFWVGMCTARASGNATHSC